MVNPFDANPFLVGGFPVSTLSMIVAGIAMAPAALSAKLAQMGAPAFPRLVLNHISGTGFLMAGACTDPFAKVTTGLLGKQPDGNIHPLGLAAWWPYHAGLHLKLAVGRGVKDEPLYNQILPGWYLGGWTPSADALPPGPPPSVLDVTCELPRRHTNRYLCLPTWDTQAPAPDQIEDGVRFVLAERSAGRPVYIHCAHGHGRSATLMAAAFLAQGLARDAAEAVALMRSERPLVRLNRRQLAALHWWHTVYGKGHAKARGAKSLKDEEVHVARVQVADAAAVKKAKQR